MKWRGERQSDQVEDRRGMTPARGGMAIGGGAALLVLLFALFTGQDPRELLDAIGGGALGSDIMRAMEKGAVNRMTAYSRYGSAQFKQLYVYGALDPAPMVLDRLAFGFQWSVSGWLLTPFLQRVGAEITARLRKRVFDELTTTFATRYTRTIGLAEALKPEVLEAYERKATGEKFLINPTLN